MVSIHSLKERLRKVMIELHSLRANGQILEAGGDPDALHFLRGVAAAFPIQETERKRLKKMVDAEARKISHDARCHGGKKCVMNWEADGPSMLIRLKFILEKTKRILLHLLKEPESHTSTELPGGRILFHEFLAIISGIEESPYACIEFARILIVWSKKSPKLEVSYMTEAFLNFEEAVMSSCLPELTRSCVNGSLAQFEQSLREIRVLGRIVQEEVIYGSAHSDMFLNYCNFLEIQGCIVHEKFKNME